MMGISKSFSVKAYSLPFTLRTASSVRPNALFCLFVFVSFFTPAREECGCVAHSAEEEECLAFPPGGAECHYLSSSSFCRDTVPRAAKSYSASRAPLRFHARIMLLDSFTVQTRLRLWTQASLGDKPPTLSRFRELLRVRPR